MDDLKSNHVDPKVDNEFLEWLKKKKANDDIGEIKAVRGNMHDYLAMVLDYSFPGVLKLNMTAYVKAMVQNFPGKVEFPWNDKLFKVDEDSKKLNPERGMFLCKRGRQDIHYGIAFLSTRTTAPNEGGWSKL